jgi:hypothetical protein
MSEQATQTVTIQRYGKPVEVEGRVIAPGLAITPSVQDNRYALTHIPSGLAFLTDRCSAHIDRVAEMAASLSAEHGIDWTQDDKSLTGQPETRKKLFVVADAIQSEFGFCRGRACGQEDAPTWRVRCNTCDWEWDDEYDEGPLNAKEAKRMARDHECEPDIEIQAPDSDNVWVRPDRVSDDGTLHEVPWRRIRGDQS